MNALILFNPVRSRVAHYAHKAITTARVVLQDGTLKLIARELADSIKSKATLDWTQRETSGWICDERSGVC